MVPLSPLDVKTTSLGLGRIKKTHLTYVRSIHLSHVWFTSTSTGDPVRLLDGSYCHVFTAYIHNSYVPWIHEAQ